MKNLIILTFNREKGDDYILRKMNSVPGIKAFPVLKDVGFIKKCIRRLNFAIFPSSVERWFSSTWINEVNRDDIVICMANYWTPSILKNIKQRLGTRCINYYWDKVCVSGYPVVQTDYFENWSFDIEDSENYGMTYNPQFFVSENNSEKKDIIYDVCFVGADRNGKCFSRVSNANSFYTIMNDMGLSLYFRLLTESPDANKNIATSDMISMDEVVSIMLQSKAVLEIVEPNAEWLTLRPFQALSNNKKLITNNKSILQYDFYDKTNIFVIGMDDWSDLRSFLNSPFKKIAVLDKYSIEYWRDRFIQNARIEE